MSLPRDSGYFLVTMIILVSNICFSCAPSLTNPRRTHIVIREAESRQLLTDTKVWLTSPENGERLLLAPTDALGYTQLDWKKLAKRINLPGDRRKCSLICEKSFASGTTDAISRDTIILSEFMGHLDLYLSNPNALTAGTPLFKPDPVADMHYHASMKVHNTFGHQLYADSSSTIPDNLNLFKEYRKLSVFNGKKWKKPYLGKIAFSKMKPGNKWYRRYHKMKTLLEMQWVKPKGTNLSNNFVHFTQATHPNLIQGGMHLAYNSISPLEHGVSNTGAKRCANNLLVTKANKDWLKRIGRKDDHLTHWENFLLEYSTINKQKDFYDFYDWKFLNTNLELSNPSPKIVMVIEGAHALQDKYFPHFLNYNIANRNSNQDRDLLNELLEKGALDEFDLPGSTTLPASSSAIPSSGSVPLASTSLLPRLISGELKTVPKREWNDAPTEERNLLSQEVDRLLIKELTDNIDRLKALDGSPVAMITVAHLTYNGMFGHAPNLNGGSFFTRLVARKNYNMRVSDDPAYRKQWASVFFAIPGVNKFGKVVMDQLVSRENGHRVLIDLKHSDYASRAYFFDSVMIDRSGTLPDTVPPICSHCAVTGLSATYYSPLTDEFSLLNAPSTTTFNPFGINLYNEEITRICQNDGIIGIPLFQNVLGANVNKKRNYPYRYKRDTVRAEKRIYRYSRRKGIENYLGYLYYNTDDRKRLANSAFSYTEQLLAPWLEGMSSKKRDKRILEQTTVDYVSAEPFLQNLFYIIDHSGHADSRKAWENVCIGSDLDGLIDPIDICPTASGYPNFKARLIQFIPIFLEMRQMNAPAHQPTKVFEDYFSSNDFPVKRAIDLLFYESLHEFSIRHLLK